MMNFDWSGEAPTTTQDGNGEFAPIPKGTYVCAITDMHWKQKKDGSGSYIKIHWQVVGGKYDNRRIYQVLQPASQHPFTQSMIRAILMNNLTPEQLEYFKKLGTYPDDNAMQKIYFGKKMNVHVTIRDNQDRKENQVGGVSVYDPFAAAPAAPQAGFSASTATNLDDDIPF